MPIQHLLSLLLCASLLHTPASRAEPSDAPAIPLTAATTAGPAPGTTLRPRVGLVLSGGGARGAAHVGVLKVLEELHVPVDAIAGTSMGAVVGSLYASGMSAAAIERLIDSVDWQDSFHDRPPRAMLNFRRKQDDREFLVRAPLGLRGGQIRLPRGLIQGQKLNQILRSATLPVAAIDDFDRLPIPFRALATDIVTGAPVVFSRGALATAVAASMAAPGVFAPVEVDGRLLVDGGLTENLPLSLVRSMGVDVIIAVDVSSPLLPPRELDSALAVSNQMVSVLINRVRDQSLRTLGPRDVVISPELGALSSVDFGRVREAIAAGENSARQAGAMLAELAAPADEYQHFLARGDRAQPPLIEFIRVARDSGDYHKFIEAALAPLVGQPAEPQTIAPAIGALYGRDLFESLDYQVVRDAGRAGLEVSARRKSWGPNYLRFALSLQDDFQGDNHYTAGVRFVVTEVNPYMAEWNVDVKAGEQPEFAAEFFQPLGYASPWFLAPHVQFGSRTVSVRDGDRLLGEYRVHEKNLGIDLGREFGDWGEIRAGLQHISGSTALRVGVPTLQLPEQTRFRQGGFFVRASFDRLDSVNFPRRGQLLVVEWDAQRTQLGADRAADRAKLDWLVAASRDRHTLIFSTSAGSALSAAPGVQNYFPLGGFLNLSGVSAGALAGPHFGIGRLLYLYRIGGGAAGFFDVPTYVGVAAEAGNVWQRRADASFGSLRKDGAAFIGFDTFLGPLYLGAGYDQTGRTSYYLVLGRTF